MNRIEISDSVGRVQALTPPPASMSPFWISVFASATAYVVTRLIDRWFFSGGSR